MSSIIQILRRIGGAKAAPTSGSAGQLALWKAGTAPTDAASLYAHDGGQWIELVDTSRNSRVITANDSLPGLRITQTGTGEALRVEDEANPDATPFVVTTNGNVGIGAIPSAWGSGGNLELGSYQAISFQGPGCYLSTNAYFNGTSFKYIKSGFAASYSQTEGEHVFSTSATGAANAVYTPKEVFRIAKNGNVGIGRAPLQTLDVYRSGAAQTTISTANDVVSTTVQALPAYGAVGTITNQSLALLANNKEHVWVTGTGDVLVGANAVAGWNGRAYIQTNAAGSESVLVLNNSVGGPTKNAIVFVNGGAVVGNIVMSASGVLYQTGSDYRLKENVTPMPDASARVMALKPCRFNFKVEPGKTVDGFIAHEVQAVIPEAVSGEKDAVDADGKPLMQGIDQSKIVPLLTAALQDALKRIAALEARP